MNIIDILIILIIALIVYKFYSTYRPEPFEDNKNVHNMSNKIDELSESNDDYIIDDPKKYIDKILKATKTQKINPYFSEMQYHDDYRDTLNAFNLLVPSQKQVFNRSNKPLTSESVPDVKEVKRLIGNFVKEVNKIVEKQVHPEVTLNGWNDMMPEKKQKSGWEKQQEQLGLPKSIYTEPYKKAPIKLVKIDHLEKYSTDDQVRYVTFLIVKKQNVSDQMVLRVSFVLDTSDLNLDREFFDEEKSVYETVVKIEEIFVLGFMTKTSFGKQSSLQDLYNYDGINNTGITRDKDIMEQLMKKKKIYEDECYMFP